MIWSIQAMLSVQLSSRESQATKVFVGAFWLS